MTTKSTITTRSMNSQQTSGPHKKPQLIGIYESSANEFFLGDYSHLLRIPSIIPGTYDPIDEIFYPESPSSDAVVKVKYNLRKYLVNAPFPLLKESSIIRKHPHLLGIPLQIPLSIISFGDLKPPFF